MLFAGLHAPEIQPGAQRIYFCFQILPTSQVVLEEYPGQQCGTTAKKRLQGVDQIRRDRQRAVFRPAQAAEAKTHASLSGFYGEILELRERDDLKMILQAQANGQVVKSNEYFAYS